MNRAEEVWEKALDAGFAEQERGRDGTDAAVAVIATVLAECRAQGMREPEGAYYRCAVCEGRGSVPSDSLGTIASSMPCHACFGAGQLWRPFPAPEAAPR